MKLCQKGREISLSSGKSKKRLSFSKDEQKEKFTILFGFLEIEKE